MKPQGLALILALMLVPLIWLPGILAGRDLAAGFSQYIGLIALIAMAVSHVIATRWAGVEAVFGPLDQSYRLHKWLGLLAMVAILLHDTIDADMRGLGRETGLNDLAETLGEISLYGLLILVVITVAAFIPYHMWKWTHRLIGIFFVFGAFHYLFILKPFANGDPLGIYMAVICGVGVIAYIYTSAPRGLRPARDYRIDRVEAEGGALAVEMSPVGRPVRHVAGQFAFFGFSGAGLPEPHPFTISSAPRDDGSLRLTIAPLGDLTRKVSEALGAGQKVRVDGAFGHFGAGPPRPEAWIAAGVGVTPFVALAEALAPDAPPVLLIYCVRETANAPHLGLLEEIAAQKANLRIVVWESAERGRLGAGQVSDLAGDGLAASRVLFCGPTPMRETLQSELSRHGVSSRDFHYEAFEIRTGLGIWPLLMRILGRS